MANFSKLPNEMVSEVWSFIPEPRDLESFALVSKHVYAMGKPFLEEHNKLRKNYSFLQTDIWTRTYDLAFFLKEVLLRPRAALYVTHLSIDRYLEYWQDQRNDNESHVPYPDDVTTLFVEAIHKSSFVPLNEAAKWITSFKEGNQEPILALLILLLPNLTTITVTDNGYPSGLLQETIQRVAEAQSTTFLTRLVRVNLTTMFIYNYDDMNFYWLRTFAALPLLQSMCLYQMGLGRKDYSIDDTLYFSPGIYNITKVTFVRSGLRPKILFQLLESIKGLKRFSYVEPHELLCRFEPFWIRVALLANAKHSLESLKILSPPTHEHELLGTLREFTSLKELKTNARLLGDPDELDKLADLLPASLEKIYQDTCDFEAYKIVPSLVGGIVKAKSKLIPRLESLKLRTNFEKGAIQEYRNCIEPLVEMCQNVGIKLAFVAT